jgi:glutathione S-transferase
MTNLTLYSMPSSGNSYKVRLLLAFLGRSYRHVGLEYETKEIAAAHHDGVLPLGKLPVLECEDGRRIPESNAILWYLAEGTDWIPDDAVARAEMLGWMFWEQNQHEATIAVRAALRVYAHRRHLATPERMADLLEAGHERLQQMESHLSDRAWLIGARPSLADIALFAYTHTAGTNGGFDMTRFPNVNAWIDRVVTLPGFITLDEIPE